MVATDRIEVIKNIIKLNGSDNVIFMGYKVENDEIVKVDDFFSVKNLIVKMDGSTKQIKEINDFGIKIYGIDVDYDSILNSKNDVEILYEAPDFQFKDTIKIKGVEFIEKEGDKYVFYVSLDSLKLKEVINEIMDSIINNEKLDLLIRAENDDL